MHLKKCRPQSHFLNTCRLYSNNHNDKKTAGGRGAGVEAMHDINRKSKCSSVSYIVLHRSTYRLIFCTRTSLAALDCLGALGL